MRNRTIMKKRMLTWMLSGVVALGSLSVMSVDALATPSSGIATGGVNVREDIDGDVVDGLQKDQEVSITDEKESDDGYTWYKVKYTVNDKDREGWVRSDLLDTENSSESSADSEEGTDETVSGTFVSGTCGYDLADSIDEDLPSGFEETTLTVDGTEVDAAKMENADIYLLYLVNTEDSSDEGFFVYDRERNTVSPFVEIGDEDNAVLLIDAPAAVADAVSSRYVESDCSFEGGTVLAYQLAVADDTVASDADIADFYYIYGVKEDGTASWYVYDQTDETLQRSMTNMQYVEEIEEAAPVETEDTSSSSPFETDSITKMLLCALGLICLLFLILVIVLSARYRKLCRYIDDEYEPEEVYEEKEPEKPSRKEKKAAKKAAKEARKRKKEEEEFDDLDLEEEEPVKPSRKEKKVVKPAELPKEEPVKAVPEQKKVVPEQKEAVPKKEEEAPKQKKASGIDFLKRSDEVSMESIEDILNFDDDYDDNSDASELDKMEFDRFEEEPEFFDEEDDSKDVDLEQILMEAINEPEKKESAEPEREAVKPVEPEIPAEEPEPESENSDGDSNWDDLEFL